MEEFGEKNSENRYTKGYHLFLGAIIGMTIGIPSGMFIAWIIFKALLKAKFG